MHFNWKSGKGLFAFALLLLATLTLFSTLHKTQEQPQILKINLADEPPTLDPRHAYDITSSTVIRMMYEGLTRLNHEGEAELALAKEVKVSEDRLTYRFRLRKTVWSNGEKLTAYDFVRSWLSILDPSFAAEFANRLFVIRGAELAKEGSLPLDKVGLWAEDERTLVVELKRPTPHFLQLLATYTFFPVHRNGLSITNGPFLLKEHRYGDEIRVERNPLYWDADSVKLDEIQLLMITNETTELSLFEQGDLHWAGSPMSTIPLEAIPELKRTKALQTREIYSTYYYKCNTEHAPLHHPKIRRALSMAIDREAIIDHIWHGDHRPAWSLIPPNLGGKKILRYDPESARLLFDEALRELNLTRETLPPIVVHYNKSDDHHKVAQAIQQQWKSALNFEIKIQGSEWRVHLSKMALNDFQIANKTWLADYSGALAMLEPFQHRNDEHAGANNDTRWHDPRFELWIEKGLSEPAEKLFMHDLPAIPLFHITHRYLKAPSLRGVVYPKVGQIDFKKAYFKQ